MKCRICKQEDLSEWDDGLMGCNNCGAAFELNYAGYCEDGENGIIEKGFEPKEFVDKYKDTLKEEFY